MQFHELSTGGFQTTWTSLLVPHYEPCIFEQNLDFSILVYVIVYMFLWLQLGENLYTHVKLVDKFIYSGLEIQKYSGGHISGEKWQFLKPLSGNDFKIFWLYM